MQVIIDYFKNNPKFTTTLLITLAVCLIICIAIVIIRKMRFKNLHDNSFNEGLNCANEEQNCEFCQDNNQDFEITCDCDSIQTQNEDNLNNKNTLENCEVNDVINNNLNECDLTEKQSDINEFYEVEKNQNAESPASDIATTNTKTNEEELLENSEDENELQINSRYAGKWIIYKENGRFVADLKASNGEKMLSTESYTSLSGIKSGIDTLKKNIASGNYAINLDKNGNYVFKIFSTANRLLCIGEGYSTKEQCEKAFASVKRFSKTAYIVNQCDFKTE